jgi:Uma2 family endonuclease
MTDVAAQSSFMTADELIQLPSGTWRYELIDGVLRRMTPAGHVHGRVAAEVGAHLTLFVRQHRLGETYAAETGFLLRRSPDTVRAPDAAFVSRERLASMTLLPEGYFPGPPDLAVEVLSPSDTVREVAAKTADWLASGCRAVLELDPATKTAMLHRPDRTAEHFASTASVMLDDLLPGWSIPLAELFR